MYFSKGNSQMYLIMKKFFNKYSLQNIRKIKNVCLEELCVRLKVCVRERIAPSSSPTVPPNDYPTLFPNDYSYLS